MSFESESESESGTNFCVAPNSPGLKSSSDSLSDSLRDDSELVLKLFVSSVKLVLKISESLSNISKLIPLGVSCPSFS